MATGVIYIGMQISAVTWRTVYQHIVADMFHAKKRSLALIVHEQ